MTHFILSSWKRPRTGLLILCLALMLALAACGSSTTPGSGDLTGGATPTATTSGSSGSPTATTSTGGSSPTATPSGSGTPDAVAPPFFFTVRATASNSIGDYTLIDNVVTNGDPGLVLFVTANYNPNGVGGIYDNHPLGVFYIAGSTNKWAIYHDDKTPYTLNASYNVWARETSQPGTFIWRASAASSAGDYTIIDNPATNGNPNVVILVTHNWNPGGVAGIYDNHRLGVFYIGSPTNKWAIYHQDTTPYTLNANYNVYATVADGATRFVAHTCSAPCTYDYTTFSSSASNNKPGAIVFVTANWNPGGTGGVYDDHNLGVFYASGYLRWAVFHQDASAYIANTSFNVVIPQTGE